ncbi:MAG: hypothetical protein DHS20C11_32270 [Lysobacteraceae bacterium]|nr:MAG: hypothetical protein DHS20C11_32270 [Xanthomonadaceae bacterium]
MSFLPKRHSLTAFIIIAVSLLVWPVVGSAGVAATTTTVVAKTPNPSEAGYGIVVEVEVRSLLGEPTGQVLVSAGAVTCSIQLPARSCVLRLPAVGDYQLIANYSGDSNFAASVSAPVSQAVASKSLIQLVSRNRGNQSGFARLAGVLGREQTTSRNNRWTVYASGAIDNPSDPGRWSPSVFLYDHEQRTTQLISSTIDGIHADGPSYAVAVSDDGQKVLFMSLAENLVSNVDTNGEYDVFLKNVQTGEVRLISKNLIGVAVGGQGTSLSSDGRYVLFSSESEQVALGDTNGVSDAFLRDTLTDTVALVSVSSSSEQGDGDSSAVAMTPNARFILFGSEASNFDDKDNNSADDVFIRDHVMGTTRLVSHNMAGYSGNGDSFGGDLSNDGTKVLFSSVASDLVETDTNGVTDVFMFDFDTNTSTRISVSTLGSQGDDRSFSGSLSGDGTVAVFLSTATTLTDDRGYVPFRPRLFWRDIGAGVTSQLIHSDGENNADHDICAAVVSDDGQSVIIEEHYTTWECHNGFNNSEWGPRLARVRLSDGQAYWQGPRNVVVDQLTHRSERPLLTFDGRKALLSSSATNSLPEVGNGWSHVYISERGVGIVDRVDTNESQVVPAGQSFGYVMSPNGRFVAIQSQAYDLIDWAPNNLARVYVFDRLTRELEHISQPADGSVITWGGSVRPSLSDDGQIVAFASTSDLLEGIWGGVPTGGRILIKDRQTDELVQIEDYTGTWPLVSAAGRYVVFQHFTGILRWDRDLQVIEHVSTDLSDEPVEAENPSIAGEARYVAFSSESDSLVANDLNGLRDVFVKDMDLGTVQRVSLADDGDESKGESDFPSVSGDGRFVVFESDADNLVVGDSNGEMDVFVHDRETGRTALLSIGRDGAAEGQSDQAVISRDGTTVAFRSWASNLLLNDINNEPDIFVVPNPLSDLLFVDGLEFSTY